MKNHIAIALMLLCSCIPCVCQQQLDAATKEDVEELMTLSGSKARIQQMWAEMGQQAATSAADAYRLKHPDATPLELRKAAEAAGAYMQDVIKAFSVDEFLAAIVPVYQAHLTHSDVRSIIDFYNSSSGQKMLKEMPAMMSESMTAIQPILKEHLPEIQAAAEKAFADAAKGSGQEDGAAASSH